MSLLALAIPAVLCGSPQQVHKLNGPLAVGLLGDALDVRLAPDGSVAVYRADQDTDQVFELYAADESLSGAVKLNAPLSANRAVEPDYLVSPDGTRVVYRADQDASNVVELYSVPIDASSAPVRLNAPLPTGGDVQEFQISPDGSRVVYRADQDTNGRLELYSVPIDGSSGPVRLNDALGAMRNVLSGFEISPDGGCVVYLADRDRDNVFELFAAPITASGTPRKLSGALVVGGDVTGFAISPDGSHVVYLANQNAIDVVELFARPIDGSGSVVRLNGSLVAGGNVQDFSIASDGGRVAYRADQDADEQFELYSVPIDAGSGPIKLSTPLAADRDVVLARASPAGDRVVYGTQRYPFLHQDELYSVPIDGSQAPVQLNDSSSPNRVVRDVDVSPDGSRVVYSADQDTDNVLELYSVPIDGSQASVRLNAPFMQDADLADSRPFEISSDSSRVVYLADQDIDYVLELFSVPIDGGSTPVRLNAPLGSTRSVTGYTLSADGSRVAYIADQDANNVFEVYARGIAGGPGPDKLSGPFTPGALLGDVTGYRVSPDGRWVVYRADQDTDDVFELYAVPIDESGPPVRLNGDLISGRDVWSDFSISPDSARVVYAVAHSGEPCGDLCELYSVLIDGSASPILLNGPLGPTGGLGYDFQISPDASHVVYLAHVNSNFTERLFAVPIDGGQAPIPLHDAPMYCGVYGFVVSPDGSRVVYLSDDDGRCWELFSVPIDRHEEPVKLNGPLVPGGTVGVELFGEFSVVLPQISPDSSTVLYYADQDTNDLVEIYSAPIDGSRAAVKLNDPFPPDGGLLGAVIANDTRVVFEAVVTTCCVFELFTVPLDRSQAPVRLHPPLGPGMETEGVSISPDGNLAVFRADLEGVGFRDLYSVPVDASASPTRLHVPLTVGGRVGYYRISPDSSRVAFWADLDGSGIYELYGVPIDGSSTPRHLNGPLLGSTDVQTDFQFAPGSRRVIYRAAQETLSVYDLYAVGIDGGAPVKLSGPILPNGGVSSFRVASTGGWAVYRAVGDTPGVVELYASNFRSQPAHAPPRQAPAPAREVVR